jgi:hypothetical protein
MTKFYYSLWLNKIQLHINTTFFLIHSLVVGHLSYFHSLAIGNNVAISMGVQCLCCNLTYTFFQYIPGNGVAESYGSSIVSFQGTSILLSIVVVLTYIPTSSV